MKKSLQILFFAFILGVTAVNTAQAQTYDPLAVQRINDLIANNGLPATPNAPETWGFAIWNDEKPKQLLELYLSNGKYLKGDVLLIGLTRLKKFGCTENYTFPSTINVSNCTQLLEVDCQGLYGYPGLTELNLTNCVQLQKLICNSNELTKLDLTGITQLRDLDCYSNFLTELDISNCVQLRSLICFGNKLSELNLTKCKQLEYLSCGSNYNITKLDLTDLTQLKKLDCSRSFLTELDLTNLTQLQEFGCIKSIFTELDMTCCTQLQYLYCYDNKLFKLDLSGLDKMKEKDFIGIRQSPQLTLYKNENDEYTCSISLNNPTFENSAISYSDGILKSANNTVTSTSFTIQTNKEGCELSGEMNFSYSDVGIDSLSDEPLQIYPNPTTGKLTIDYGQLIIDKIEIFDIARKIVSSNIQISLSSNHEIDISNLNSGIYFVKVTTERGEIVKKIVKQ